jgi:hypothetical protein
MSRKQFTRATGAPIADNTNILTAGRRGPALLQDVWLIEKPGFRTNISIYDDLAALVDHERHRVRTNQRAQILKSCPLSREKRVSGMPTEARSINPQRWSPQVDRGSAYARASAQSMNPLFSIAFGRTGECRSIIVA